jgi:PIN domain nuclease of toxin-antitoxin system
MRLLLDTHVLVWALETPEKIRLPVREWIADTANEVWASSAALGELVLKAAKGKLSIPEDLPHNLHENDITELPVNWAHTMEVLSLPAIHKDPFDRILVAQARIEGMSLVTRDGNILQYPVSLIEA